MLLGAAVGAVAAIGLSRPKSQNPAAKAIAAAQARAISRGARRAPGPWRIWRRASS
jgi:hypothetical protein